MLEQLPPGHVERNNALDRLTRFRSTQSSGEPGTWYFSSTNEAAIGGSGDDAFFESSLRHEVGHGVDQKLGRAATAAPADKAVWVQWMDALSAALDAVNHSPTKAINGLGALDQIPIVDEMVTTMGSQDTDNVKVVAALRARIAALGIWAAMPAAGRDALKQRVLLDPRSGSS